MRIIHSASEQREEAMTDIKDIKDTVKVCMFDQYGTVVDMQGGLVKIATPFLKKKGWTGNPNSFVTWWRRTHFENSMIDALLHREHTPYREIGHRAVSHVMDRAGIEHTKDEVRYLVGEIEKLECFPEVPAALAKLQTKYKLVVLSNGDPRHARDRQAISQGSVRQGDLRRRSELLQAARRDLHQGRRDPRREARTRSCSSRTTPSTASARSRPACARPSSTAAIGRSSETPHQPDILVPTMKDLADAIV